jgi:choline dehydrogenase-like flavoprotein
MPPSLQADIIVVGSGPGGATLARELAGRGKKVLALERGIDHRRRFYYGTYLGPLIYCDRGGWLFTEQGLNIVRPLMVGGATSMYCGCAALPPPWLKAKYGVDLETEVSQTITELDIRPLPEDLRGPASTRIARAAQSLGYNWEPQLKFMRPARSPDFRCSAACMLGCRCGAKWNAAEFVDQAVASGAVLRTRANVRRVLVEGHTCTGVEGVLNGKPFTAQAQTVVLAAGGIGTPSILQHSGFEDAGIGLTMDTTVMVYGCSRYPGIGKEPPMTWSWENLDEGYMLSTLLDPWLVYPTVVVRKGIRYPLYWPRWNRMLGVMIKLRDEVAGGVFPNGKISKPMTEGDRRRLAAAQDVAERILVEAGADRGTLFVTPQRGTHPSGTVRIGTMLDRNLQTSVAGLHVCDASVFPEALGRPTVLTIIGLARRLAKHLTGNV